VAALVPLCVAAVEPTLHDSGKLSNFSVDPETVVSMPVEPQYERLVEEANGVLGALATHPAVVTPILL
jgi:hypothetical protein